MKKVTYISQIVQSLDIKPKKRKLTLQCLTCSNCYKDHKQKKLQTYQHVTLLSSYDPYM